MNNRNLITEKKFATAMFFCRFFCAGAFVYTFLGIFFHLRTFAENLTALGITTFAVPLSLIVCIMGLLLSLALLLGYRTRISAFLLLLSSVVGIFVFTSNNLDRIYISFMLFALSALMPVLFLGAGSISLDYKNIVEKEKKFLSR